MKIKGETYTAGEWVGKKNSNNIEIQHIQLGESIQMNGMNGGAEKKKHNNNNNTNHIYDRSQLKLCSIKAAASAKRQ